MSRRWWFGGVVVTLLLSMAMWIAALAVKSPAQRAAEASPPAASPVTAEVEYRRLADTIVTRGDVAPGASVMIGSALTGIVTRTPVSEGASISEGGVAAEVAGRPVLILQGASPMFRDVRPGSSGADVSQLQAGLARIGFDPGETDGHFGPGTKSAIVKWYKSLGYEPVLTSDDAMTAVADAGRRVREASESVTTARENLEKASAPIAKSTRLELDGRVEDAEGALVTAILSAHASIGAAEGEAENASDALSSLEASANPDNKAIADARVKLNTASATVEVVKSQAAQSVSSAERGVEAAKAIRDETLAPKDLTEAKHQVADAETQLGAETEAQGKLAESSGPMIPVSELVFVPSASVVMDKLSAKVGDKPSGDWMRLATSSFVVTTTLDAANRALVPLGSSVVMDDEVTGVSFTGKLGKVADDLSEGSSDSPGYSATVFPDKPIDQKLSGQNLRLTITAAQSETKEIVVPLSAVFARADGSYVVRRVEGKSRTDVAVRPGLSAGGFVVIDPGDNKLAAGQRVLVSEAALEARHKDS